MKINPKINIKEVPCQDIFMKMQFWVYEDLEKGILFLLRMVLH